MYPNWNPKDLKAAVQIWNEALREYSYEEMHFSLMQFFKNDMKGFAPIPGQLIRPVAERKIFSQNPEEGKAWAMVREAIGNSGYNSREEFDKLPPLAQKAVGSAYVLYTWSQTDSDALGTVENQFMKTYRRLMEDAIAENAATGALPEKVIQIEEKAAVPLIEEKQEITDEHRLDLLAWWEELKKEAGHGMD